LLALALGRAEVDLGRRGDRALVLDGEVRLHLVAEEHRRQVGREGAHRDVVALHRLDVAVPRHGDPVLGALELGLQVAEIGVGLELRVVLGDDEEPRERAAQVALGFLELPERLRILDELGRRLDGAHARARLGHLGQDLLLLVGEALHRVDEVRDEVGPPLVLVHYLGPGRLDLLVAPLQLVVAAAGQEEGEEHREEEPGFGLVHVRLHGRAACRRWGWRKALSRRPFRPRRPMTSPNIRETRSGLGLRPTPPTDLPMPRPFGILVASDGSPSAQAALDTALAFPWPATSRARGVVALGPLKGFRASTRTALVRAVDETSRALQEALAERWPAAEALALHGAPAEAIVIESRRFRADVVVLGWRGHGRFRRLLAGSVSRSV